MIARRAFLAGTSAVIAAGLPSPAAAEVLTSIKVWESRTLPEMGEPWFAPNDQGQLFYIKRSTSHDAVVYVARFRADGSLDPERPVHAYWRRFNLNRSGPPRELTGIEFRCVYGYTARPGAGEGEFRIALKRLASKPMVLRQTGPRAAELVGEIGGRTARAVYAFATIRERRIAGFEFPASISLHGLLPETETAINELFRVSNAVLC